MKPTPNPRVCGRRVCSGPCGRWRPLVDFPWRWPKNKNTHVIEGVCNTCKHRKENARYREDQEYRQRKLDNVKVYRENNKEKIQAYKGSWEQRQRRSELNRRKYVPRPRVSRVEGPPVPPISLRETDLDLFNKMRRVRHKWLMENNPDYRQRRLEYNRIYQEAKRRERGAKVSNINARQAPEDYERVPAGPFRQWLVELWSKSDVKMDLEHKIGLSDRQIRRIVDGTHAADDTVDIDLIDRCLVKEGSTMLYELYPALYQRAA